jgi:hypothetical protein
LLIAFIQKYVGSGIKASQIRIPDPGGKKAPDPGSGSATLLVLVIFAILNG